MTSETIGPIRAHMVMDHEDLDVLFDQLIAAYETNDRDTAAAAYEELEDRLRAHLAAEEELLFPEFARSEPVEAASLLEEHQRIRARVDELAVGVDLHATRIGAIRELVQMLRAHAAREDRMFYRWADRTCSNLISAPDVANFFVHGRSPYAPVRS